MSEINCQALREAAEKATKGSYIVGHTSVNQNGNLTGVFVCQKWKGEPGGVIAECHVNCLVETDAQAYANAEFIAAFNPKVALAILDKLEAKDKRIAELEAREIQLPAGFDLRYGHPINADERHVMIPKENGNWIHRTDLEHSLRVAGIRIKGD